MRSLLMHSHIVGSQVDYEAAADLLHLPAVKGNFPEAQFALGYLVANGQGVKVDKTA